MKILIIREFTSVYFLATAEILVPVNAKFVTPIIVRRKGRNDRKWRKS